MRVERAWLRPVLLALIGTAGCARSVRTVTPEEVPYPRAATRDERRQDPGTLGSRAAEIALSFRGRPYCWGGSGPSCFDCSGLTRAAWRAAGVRIGRTSAEQRELPEVPMSALAPGDILWRPSSSAAGHVGLYVGDGWAVHAPGRGKRVQLEAAYKFASAHRPW